MMRVSRLRDAQGKDAGEEAFNDLLDFLSERNAAAAIALKARKDDLTAFHNLNVPSTLNVTFLSTNCIEKPRILPQESLESKEMIQTIEDLKPNL